MNIDGLEILVTFLLGVGLASERLISLLKSAIPALADNPEADPNTAWNRRWRPLVVQALSFLICGGTVALLTRQGLFSNWFTNRVQVSASVGLPVVVVGLLASGGSAFWNNFLGWTKAAKDIKKQDAAVASAQGVEARRVHVDRVVAPPAHV